MPISIALVDDHNLVRKALVNLIASNDTFEVVFDADNGKDFIDYLEKNKAPDVILLDINLPVEDGFAIATKIRQINPNQKFIAVTVDANEAAIIKMIKLGARGYIFKDADPEVLFEALEVVHTKGYYYTDFVSKTMARSINFHNKWDLQAETIEKFSPREITFLEHICNDLSYKQIGEKMSVSVRTVDGYRDSLFQKINVRTRVGLVIFAIRNGIVKI